MIYNKHKVYTLRPGPQARSIWVDITTHDGIIRLDGNTLALVIVDQHTGGIWTMIISDNTSAVRVLNEWLSKKDRNLEVSVINRRWHPQLQTAAMTKMCEERGITLATAMTMQETAAETMHDVALASM
jgi:hypothetical protein